jgi:hypothetical protein
MDFCVVIFVIAVCYARSWHAAQPRADRWAASALSRLQTPYTVAIRLARKVCAGRRRRLVLEQRQETAQPRDPLAELSARELCSALDEEMLRLPTNYRTAIVLCCLQGKSRDEAAQELGWTPGAVKGRLERGRELLQRRLVRRGIELSMALGAGLLVERQAAAVSATLTTETNTGGCCVFVVFRLGTANFAGCRVGS